MSDAHITRNEIRTLLDGGAPNPEIIAQSNGWGHVLTALHEAHTQGGTVAVIRLFNGMAKVDRNLAALMAGPPPSEKPVSGMPPLPVEARAIYEHSGPCGDWLDNYISFAGQAAPMTPTNFHEAAGLFAVATAIARRLVFHHRSDDMFPNLYMLYLAPSGYGKTTAFNILQRVIQRAGLSHLLLTDQMTPENFVTQLSTTVPPTLKNWDVAAQEAWLKERALAATRGWAVDEASFLFDGFSREYMSGLLGLLLRCYQYDPSGISRETQSGGRVVVHDASLSFFGSTTPAGMRAHLQSEVLWSNGLWPRFALLAPDRPQQWIDDGDETPLAIPPAIVSGLRRVADLFPTPRAELHEDAENNRRYVTIYGKEPPSAVALDRGVQRAWQAYRKATSFDLGVQGSLDEMIKPSYNRFADHAMKIAMVLATMDTEALPVHVTLAHYARGQQIAEQWRESLHLIWSQETKIDEQRLADKILAKLKSFTPAGKTARELQQLFSKRSKDIREVLTLLSDAGLVEANRTGRTETWHAL